jgi:hypothetical protein
MELKRWIAAGLLFAAGAGITNSLEAQDRGRRRSFDPAEFLKGMDRNGNGMIDPDEMSERGRSFIERVAQRVGLDASQPLPLDKLTEGFNQMRQEREGDSERGRDDNDRRRDDDDNDRDRDRDRDRRRDDDDDDDRNRDRSRSESSRTPPPRTPGFGVPDTAPKAAGFDVPLGQDNAMIEKRFERRVIEYVDRMLNEQDTNKDGFIDNIEWKAGRWSTPPESSDTNNDKRLSKMELCVRIAKRFGGDREAPQGSSSGSSSGGSSSGNGSSSSSSSNSSGGEAAKFRAYAEGLIKQYDADKSGMLEKSKNEWDKLKDDHREADANKDSVITLEEMIVKLQSYSSGSSRSSSSTSSSSSSRSGSGRSQWWKKDETAKEEPKKSYRFLSPTERLPKGLPDWFARSDTDGDGQIMMAEYAAAWTEAAAQEFLKNDLDGDGVITPAEALAAATKK